ncbi:tyrosine-type recombinase/integrase [Phytohabitans suffuscus]
MAQGRPRPAHRPAVPDPARHPTVPRRRATTCRQEHAAAATCPSPTGKTVTPHTLRHSTAMALLHAGVDTSVIALWLGHETADTTQIYLHADLTIKERAFARIPPNQQRPQ